MPEEEKSEDKEQSAEEIEAQGEEQAPEADAPAVEEERPPEGEVEEAAAEEAAEDTPQADESAAVQAEASEVDAPAEGEDLDWKTRRRLERSRLPTEASPQRSPQERQGERERGRGVRAVMRRRHRQSRRAKKGAPRVGTSRAERRPNPAKVRQGVVVSDRADKTITVRIDIARRHPTYEKIVRRSRTLHAHDERNEAGQGDVVRVIETRPISRSKRWRLLQVVKKAQ
jgi:small subunit ribosomal protein S17